MASPPQTADSPPTTTENEDKGWNVAVLSQILQIGVSFNVSESIRSEGQNVPCQISFDSMPDYGLTSELLLEEFQFIAAKSCNSSSPNFLGFPNAAMNIYALGRLS
ncbi:glutamic acid decarboxylase [Fusarium beomiforme]|uniref:Glutamic acid decarboxylase n=1 Tax=Fusarium beomiforme TaxID=44412 RepID=A0A9P5AHJ4_9HYPO|nr:glutamic acid decarboxylase [Fusarium beomiforme]